MIFYYVMLFLTSIITLFPLGYAIEYAKQKIATNSDFLPDWKGNFGKMFLNGLKMFGGMLLFGMASYTIISFIFLFLFIILLILTVLIFLLLGLSPDSEAFLLTFLIICLLVFIPLYLGYIMLMLMAYSSFLVDTNPLAFFNFKRIGSIAKKNLLNLFVIILVCVLIGILSTLLLNVSINIWFIISLIYMFYMALVTCNLSAQYTQIGMKKYLTRMEAKKQSQQQG